MRRLLSLLLAATVVAAHTACAIQTTKTFTLENARTEKRFGPFEMRGGANVILGSDLYRLRVEASGEVTFVGAADGAAFGPYEVVEGRIALIAGTPYTIIDLQTIAVSEPPPPAPSPAPRLVAVAPSPSPAPAPKEAVPETPAPAPEPQRVEPSAAAVEPAPGVATTVPPPLVEREPELPVAVGLGFSLVDSAAYEWTIDGIGTVDTQIDRNDMFLSISRGGLRARVGLVFLASVDDTVDSEDLLLQNVELSDGQGWWVGLDYRGRVLSEGPWALNLSAEGLYRSETYTLSYDAWASGQVVTPVGTNGSNRVETVWQYASYDQDISLTEASARAGIDVSYTAGAWEAYAGPRRVFVDSTDFTGTLRAGEGTYDFDFERSGAVTVVGGVRVASRALRWYAEVEAGDDTALRFGVSRDL